MLPHFHINRVQLPAWRTQGSHIPDAASVQRSTAPSEWTEKLLSGSFGAGTGARAPNGSFCLVSFLPQILLGGVRTQEVYDRFLVNATERRQHHHILVAETTVLVSTPTVQYIPYQGPRALGLGQRTHFGRPND